MVDAAGGDTSAVSQAFSQSREYADLFVGKSSAEAIDIVYVNLFGRHAE